MSEEDDSTDETISAADEQALTDLFAALVADAPAAEISPSEIIKLGRIEQRQALDVRIKRFKVIRNVLVAAAFAALVVLIVPHLGSGSSETATAASSSSSSSSAASAAASGADSPQPAGAAATGSAAAGSAASGNAAESGVAPAGSSSAAAPAAPMSVAASSAASGSSAVSSGVASSAVAVPDATSATGGDVDKTPSSSSAASSSAASTTGSGSTGTLTSTSCPTLSAKTLAAFRSAFPAGYFGPAGLGVLAMPCGASQSRLVVVKGNATVTVTVRKAAVGACRAGCVPAQGQTRVFLGDTSGNGRLVVAPVYVYAAGYEVAVEVDRAGSNPTAPTFDQLVAGARAVIKTLG